jgi:hypothetical protein
MCVMCVNSEPLSALCFGPLGWQFIGRKQAGNKLPTDQNTGPAANRQPIIRFVSLRFANRHEKTNNEWAVC